MNATELYHQDGKSAGVFYCTACRCVQRTKEEADQCCAPTKCRDCGQETGRKWYVTCAECDRKNRLKQEAERFEKAEKRTGWDGWVYREGTGRDGFSESLSDFWENWENDHAAGDEPPTYVWACTEHHFARADLDEITERIAENGYEDFDGDDLRGLVEFKAAIQRFNEANHDLVSYAPDYRVAVLLNAKRPPTSEHCADCAPEFSECWNDGTKCRKR
jgi:hypothetical protein